MRTQPKLAFCKNRAQRRLYNTVDYTLLRYCFIRPCYHHHRVATGSFDQQTRSLDFDGKLLLTISCNAPVTGLAYLPQLKVLWVAAGTSSVTFYEPKLGEDVCELCTLRWFLHVAVIVMLCVQVMML